MMTLRSINGVSTFEAHCVLVGADIPFFKECTCLELSHGHCHGSSL